MKHVLPILVLLPQVVLANVSFKQYQKNSADIDLAAMIKVQDDTASRQKSRNSLKLLRRDINNNNGIEKALFDVRATKDNPVLIIARLTDYPSNSDWQSWSQTGIEFVSYLGRKHWLIRVKTDIKQAFSGIRAQAFSQVNKLDKIAPSLDHYQTNPSFYDKENDFVVIEVDLANKNTNTEIKQRFHKTGLAFSDNSSGTALTLVTSPNNVKKIAELNDVLMITPGQWQEQTLMAEARAQVNADDIRGAHGLPLTGDGIKMANWEGISATHPDFRDSNGVGRWTAVAQSSCLNSFTGNHAYMTSGIMLGNGASSIDHYGRRPDQYRGIAPKATFECFNKPAARANVSSHSRVRNWCRTYRVNIDKEVIGLSDENRFHPQTMAAGNNGQGPQYCGPEKGYFSLLNPNKNPMIVGMGQLNGDINSFSSVGPTFDGRIKPDIIAAVANHAYPEGEFKLAIKYIKLIREGSVPQVIYDWDFSNVPATSPWNLGWGDHFRGNQFIDFYQLPSNDLGLTIEAAPWSTYNNLPSFGTTVTPSGQLLSDTGFIGQEGDVLRVAYRALDPHPGFFNLRTSWFRSFPLDELKDWYSQGHIQIQGYADNTWRTMDIPVGKGAIVTTDPLEPWTSFHTWKNHPIDFIALNFYTNKLQMTPDHATTSLPTTSNKIHEIYQAAGGTSAASPMVAGGYALALEQYKLLYPNTDLEARSLTSAYNLAGTNIGPPKNSTLKGLFIHTADDVTQDSYDFYMLDNPDTADTSNQYHEGPDYVTGYGMLNIRKAIQHMTALSDEDNNTHYIIENKLTQSNVHQYTINLDQIEPFTTFKATLVWDDAPSSSLPHVTEPKLVNNLSLLVQSPDQRFHQPWSMDLPYDIYDPSIGLPTAIEPEPITINPARRNQPNDRDNVEQVEVKLSLSSPGEWTIYVSDSGMGDTSTFQNQSYSLIISPQ